jgi:hypothetical protein
MVGGQGSLGDGITLLPNTNPVPSEGETDLGYCLHLYESTAKNNVTGRETIGFLLSQVAENRSQCPARSQPAGH